MSSEEGDTLETFVVPAKKRRIQRACDACRQKRRACDGMRSAVKKCTYCIDNGMDCIYSGAPTTTKRQSYTEVLEARLALTEKLLRKLSAERGESPGTTESSEWSKDSPIVRHGKVASNASDPGMGPGVELAVMSIRAINETKQESDDDEGIYKELANDLNELQIGTHKENWLGKSSGAMLVKVAVQLKEGYTAPDGNLQPMWGSRRMQYWAYQPWDKVVDKPKGWYAFPPPDVLSTLVDLYFEHSNMYFPLLHRPTFERAVADNLHLRDDKFGANVLLVCAIASRFSDDPRVFDPASPLDCGWKYFSQLSLELQQHMFVAPTLYDLQRYCLAIQFLDGSAPQANWTLIGIGLRMAQEVGVHRRQNAQQHTLEAELWRRAFWVLACHDRLLSCTLGRPCAMQYDDFDLELPTECDDEYWSEKVGQSENSARAFRQPPGRPSLIAFFNSFIRLNNILASCLHLLYSLNKTTSLFAIREDTWEEKIVVELDSALNKWVDSIPEHLRWDALRSDSVFFKQSVALYCGYYHLQMTVHRSFIPVVRKKAPTALPSLAICTNAARSCSHVADVWRQRVGGTPAIILLPALTTAGVVLLLNVWSGKRTGVAPHMNSTITEVHKCMQAIRVCEQRWQMAGLFWDIINELATVGHVPLPAGAPPAETASTTEPTPPVNHHKRAHSGTDDARFTRVHEPPAAVWSEPLTLPPDFTDAPFAWLGASEQAGALPMYSSDLGRLPVYPHPDLTPYGGWSQQAVQYPPSPHWAGLPNFPPSTSMAPQQYHPARGAAHGGTSPEDILSMIDNDAIAMWANAPTSLGADDWGTYFNSMNEMNQGPPR